MAQVEMFPKDEIPLITKGGYNSDEVVSALQKEIRRGNEEAAVYWALELAESGYGQYLWRRLIVIVSEDVGLANPLAAIMVNALRSNCEAATKKWDSPEVLPIVHAVLYLSRTQKDRTVDECTEYVKAGRREGARIPIPNYAIDGHTKAGARKLKDKGGNYMQNWNVEFWQNVGRLSNRKNVGGINWGKKLCDLMGLNYERYMSNPNEVKDEL